MKKETLEEAAERFYGEEEIVNDYDISGYLQSAFLTGAKWQMERSYSEEEVKDIMAITWIKCVGNDGNNFKEIRDEILKQFKL